jgi:uncharacterized phage protein (TIGR01671 family)
MVGKGGEGVNREILFRGRRDDGTWVEGSLVHRTRWYGDLVDDYFILEGGDFDLDVYDAYQVDPATIGQYTGLTDKNGKKIFEGDIVTCRKHIQDGYISAMTHKETNGMGGETFVEYQEKQYPNFKEIDTSGVVKFDPRRGFFIDGSSMFLDHVGVEIIGNIHDKERDT